jgi:hypothetical protein
MPQDNSKTLTPTAALDQAMLGLTRVGTPFLNEDEVSLMLPKRPQPKRRSRIETE